MRPKFYFPIFLILISISFSEHVKEDSTKIEDEWLAFDKVQHFTYSLLWTLSTQYVLVNNMNMKEEDALPFSIISSLSAGIMKERLDMKKPKGYFSKKDMVANCLGILLAVVVIKDNIPSRPVLGGMSKPN